MKLSNRGAVLLAVIALTISPQAMAYIGPGLGAGALATVLGIVLGFLMLLAGVVWYPIKRIIRRVREKK